jgi:hypothetical protein
MNDYHNPMWPRNQSHSNQGMAASRDDSRRPAPLSTLQPRSADVNGQHNITPPETPVSPEAGGARSITPQPLFHNYLRVQHPFDPSTDPTTNTDEDSITVSIKQGDLILVHSIHENGWADGTLFSSGNRGWVPTNYCEAYDHPYIRNLLNAMTQFWDLLEESEEASFATFMRQDYIRGLIAGVRYLLEHASCLHRDAALVQQNVGIRRMRKGLLADLSSMVQKARELQEEASQPYAGEIVPIVLDELITKAFRVVTRAVRFVDAWTQEAMTGPRSRHNSRSDAALMSPLDLYFGTATSDALQSPTQASQPATADILSDDEHDGSEQSSNVASPPKSAPRHRSVIHTPRTSGTSHRLSLVREERRSGNAASEQLSQAQDICISHIGKFLGHHLHSRSHAELVDTTRRLTQGCQKMVFVMDQVNTGIGEPSKAIDHAKESLLDVLKQLVDSTKEVFTFSDLPEDDAVIMPEQATRLVAVGTSLIRAVGECVAQTRRRLEQSGDFQLPESPKAGYVESEMRSAIPDLEISPMTSSPATFAPTEPMSEAARKRKTLPPLPPVDTRMSHLHPLMNDIGMPSPAITISTDSPLPGSTAERNHYRSSSTPVGEAGPSKGAFPFRPDTAAPERKDSVSTCVTESFSTQASMSRDSEMSTVSEVSTRASTPDGRNNDSLNPMLLTSFGSISSMTSANTEASNEADSALLQKTYAHELIMNTQGRVTGGSLNAMVEQLTTHDTTPDLNFATTFYLTFRFFTTARELTQALIERFDYVGDSATVGKPVRLRICQCFKGWLETYWNADADREALDDIKHFAQHKLKPHLPSAAERLLELTRRITAAYENGTVVEPLVSGVGKTSMLVDTKRDADSVVPNPIISKASLNLLKNRSENPCELNILEFDALEIARQLCLMTSHVYCEIKPEELLRLGSNKKTTPKASNVLNLQKFNTDLAYTVNDTILAPTEAKKRALVIKHWIRIAGCCLETRNFECMMAIVESLRTSMIQRLRRTWELVPKKTKTKFDELKAIVDVDENWKSLRHHVNEASAPCLPFLGIYLTDLTFIVQGNPSLRQIPGSSSGANEQAISVINFDKYAKMAKVVGQIQRFQVPYRFHAVPELQSWLDAYLHRMRESTTEMCGSFHRRSHVLEPKDEHRPSVPTTSLMPPRTTASEPVTPIERPKTAHEEEKPEPITKDHSRMDLFWKHNTFGLKAAFGGRTDVNAHAG